MCSLQNNWLLCSLVSTCKPPPPSTVCPARCLEAHLCILHHQPPFPAGRRVGAPRARQLQGRGGPGERGGSLLPTPPCPPALAWQSQHLHNYRTCRGGPKANSALSFPGLFHPRMARASHSCWWGHLTILCLPYICSCLCKQTLQLSLFI